MPSPEDLEGHGWPSWLAEYTTVDGVYDECLGPDGRPRPHWHGLLRALAEFSADQLDERQRHLGRKLQASGVAFNVYARPEDRKAAWDLDLLPVVLSDDDWRSLEAAVVQRVRLAELVLSDLYGQRRLLNEPMLPPALVFGSDEFLWPCTQWQAPPPRFVSTYALDVARDPDGNWIILSDRSDTPIGQGWVVASRVALAQALPAVFLDAGVRRLGGYLSDLNASLLESAGERGRAIMLTAGPEDPGYFSHAYLARYLGLPLVESVDLTQRDGRLFVKTLEGLQPVGAILRKRQGRLLDPLYLPGLGHDGTPGLLDAARLGEVRLLNALGSGVVQHRVLGAFAEPLARHLLDEAPLLADAPVRWLGERSARLEVIASPAWRIGPLTARQDPGIRPDPLPVEIPQETLARQLAREGHRWIAERAVPLATTPCWRNGRLQPVPWALRLFACVVGDEVHVLPGGLGRLSPRPSTLGLPSGAGSKDVWVMARGDDTPVPPLLSGRMNRVTLQREARDVLSGTADALYWLGRYTERAEATLRTLRAVLSRLMEAGAAADTARLMGHLMDVPLAASATDASPADWLAGAIATLLQAPEAPNGLPTALAAIRRNGALSRGVLSQDGWSALTGFVNDRRWSQALGPILAQPPLDLVDDGIRQLLAFSGSVGEHMTRNDAWRFLDIGKRIERALQIAVLSQRGVRPPDDVDREAALAALLEIGDSYMTYRSRYVTVPMAVPVLDLLLLDETNPRGLAHQVAQLEAVLLGLPNDGVYRSPPQRTALRLLARLRSTDAGSLAPTGPGDALEVLVDEVRAALRTASDELHRAYFVVAERATTTFGTVGPEQ